MGGLKRKGAPDVLGTGKALREAQGAQGFCTLKPDLLRAAEAFREAQGAQGFGVLKPRL